MARLAARSVLALGALLAAGGVAWPAAATPDTPAAAPASAPAGQPTQRANPKFDVAEYRVEGNTVLPPQLIEDTVYPFLGPDRTIDDVEKARAALDALYARHGYPTVSTELPRQDAGDGVIVLKVIERRIGRLRIRGARYFSPEEIRRTAPSLAAGNVPNLNDVQRDILALNQWPDRTVVPVLRPGAAPDTVDVDLNVKDRLPLHASLELNNQYSADTTPLRLSTTLGYDNLWQRGDSINTTFQVAPENPNDALVASGSYLFRIPGTILSFLGSYLWSNSNVATVGGTQVIGKGSVWTARLLVPLGSGAVFSHSFRVGFDYKDFGQTILLGGTSAASPIQYMPLTATYSANWSEKESQTSLATSIVADTPVGSNTADLQLRRHNAEQGFIYLRADGTRTQDLPYGAQAWLHLVGMLSGDSLVANEQFSLGGVQTVRGYLETEALGDYGGAVQSELRTPSFVRGRLNDLRGYTFFDAGVADIHNPLVQQQSHYGLSSFGAGVRVRLFDFLSGDVAGAHDMSNGSVTRAGDNRLLFLVNGAF
jgi:hemolysin activation/secretion protein